MEMSKSNDLIKAKNLVSQPQQQYRRQKESLVFCLTRIQVLHL